MKRIVIAAAAVSLLAIAGCSSSGSDSSAPAETSTTVAEVEATIDVDAPTGVTDEEVLEVASDGLPESASFQESLTAIGLTTGEQITITMWAESACGAAKEMGLSDDEVVALLPGDVASDVTLSPEQAAQVWAAAQQHVC